MVGAGGATTVLAVMDDLRASDVVDAMAASTAPSSAALEDGALRHAGRFVMFKQGLRRD
jgi:hypothetical protein